MSIEQDYIDLFSYKRKGHLTKYFYTYRPEIYQNLLKEKIYYPFQMEVDILKEKGEELASYLTEIKEVIEIGPGPSRPILSKTIPLLEILQRHAKLIAYKAIDFNLEYAQYACEIVADKFKELKTEAAEIDFSMLHLFQGARNIEKTGNKKLFFFFGQAIFSSSDTEEIEVSLKNIDSLLDKGDFLLMGIDSTDNEDLLDKAYNNKFTYELLLNTMYHFKEVFDLHDFDPQAFRFIYKWNKQEKAVQAFLESTETQQFKIGNRSFVIQPQQKFHIATSRKLILLEIKQLFEKRNILIKKTFNLHTEQKSNFTFLIAQKMQ